MRKFNESSVKTAIIHDIFLHAWGAERVLLALIKIFPNADIYTPFINLKSRMLLKKSGHLGKVYTSFINFIPVSEKHASLYKPFIFLYWKSLNLSAYDLVISSSHSFSSKSVNTKPKTLHISYIHTPPKYLYDEYNEMDLINKPFLKFVLKPFFSYLRKLDISGAKKPDIIIANSKTVQKRIKKYYSRESSVIYPPVNIPKSINTTKIKKYYLFCSRLSKQKGARLAIKTFNLLGKKLVVVGTGPQEKSLKKIANKNIVFTGYVKYSKLESIYENAKALIYCSVDEDFGIVPVESMAHEVPVIAYKSGGVTETVIQGKTGVFFNKYSPDSLKDAVLKFEKMKFSPNELRKHASKYSEKVFHKNFIKVVVNNMKKG